MSSRFLYGLQQALFGREDEISLKVTPRIAGGMAPDPYRAAIALVRSAEDFFPSKYTKKGVAQSALFLPWLKLYETNAYVETASQIATTPAALYDLVRRGQQIVVFLARNYSNESNGQWTLSAFNSVSDRQGARAARSGMHMNYLVSRALYQKLRLRRNARKELTYEQRVWSSWLALAPFLVGAGKIGGDLKNTHTGFQLTERADFIVENVNALLHERDEPHADSTRFARLHVPNREGNRSYWSICFDSAISSVLLKALEVGALDLPWYIVRPDSTLRLISKDIDCKRSVCIITREGRVTNEMPLILLAQFLDLLVEFSTTLPYQWGNYFIEEAREIVAHLRAGDWMGLPATMVDWAIKRKFLQRYMAHGYEWSDPPIRLLDLFYHRLNDERVWRMAGETCKVRDFEMHYAPFGDPSSEAFVAGGGPRDTRAYLMELCIRDSHLAHAVRILDWSELEFAEEENKLMRKLTLSDPYAYNAGHIKRIVHNDFNFSTRARRLRLCRTLSTRFWECGSRLCAIAPCLSVACARF